MTAQAQAMEAVRRRLGDRYAIESELGRGGMGTVFLARDLRLERLVALKVLPDEFAANPALRERFLRETRTAASFSHPNIVPVHAVEESDGLLAFAMGFVEGESLAERVKRAGPLDVRGVVRLLTDIGYALAYAHGRGVVHRDIKPDNIMLERATGRALLMDFGISRPIAAAIETPGLTRVGEIVGTPEYMSPEQASGDVVDGRSDLYSLGLVALFAVTGRAVITGDTTQQILVKQLTELPPAAVVLRADLPGELAAAIDTCVAKEPGERFATAEALVETIDNARLAAPEIPLPVRLFAQEAGTLGMILFFLGLLGWVLFKAIKKEAGGLDALLPVTILFAVGLTRVLQVMSSARRLAILGFAPADVRKGLEAVLEERESLRRELRVDPDTRRRRRITRILAAVQLVMGVVLIWAALEMRIQLGPGRYHTPLGGVTMLFTGLILIGISLVLFARSPFQAPLGERLFRLLWLGPIGRAFLRRASRGVETASRPTGVSRAMARVAPPRAVPASPGPTTLEQRVTALEQWRRRIDER